MEQQEQWRVEIGQYLDEMLALLKRFVRENELSSLYETASFQQNADEVRATVAELSEGGHNSHQVALSALTAVSSLNASLGIFDTGLQFQLKQKIGQVVQQASQTISKTWKSLKKHLKSLLNGISNTLGKMLAKLPNLQEWSIGGDTGITIPLLGITGSVQLELTFGP